jgi:hypothetical protein
VGGLCSGGAGGSSQQRVELLGSPLLHSRYHVGIRVERELNAGVAEAFLHDLGVALVELKDPAAALAQAWEILPQLDGAIADATDSLLRS